MLKRTTTITLISVTMRERRKRPIVSVVRWKREAEGKQGGSEGGEEVEDGPRTCRAVLVAAPPSGPASGGARALERQAEVREEGQVGRELRRSERTREENGKRGRFWGGAVWLQRMLQDCSEVTLARLGGWRRRESASSVGFSSSNSATSSYNQQHQRWARPAKLSSAANSNNRPSKPPSSSTTTTTANSPTTRTFWTAS